jgi:hypothetical protein
MGADACLGPGAIGRLQKHFDGEIERCPRLLEVSEAELPLTGGKMTLRLGNQVGNRVVDGDRLRLADFDHSRGWRGHRDLDRLCPPAAPAIDTLTPIAAATGSSVR